MSPAWSCLCNYEFVITVLNFNCVQKKCQNQVRRGFWFVFFYKSDIRAAGDDVNMVKFVVIVYKQSIYRLSTRFI